MQSCLSPARGGAWHILRYHAGDAARFVDCVTILGQVEKDENIAEGIFDDNEPGDGNILRADDCAPSGGSDGGGCVVD
jgi:hypothetical protein